MVYTSRHLQICFCSCLDWLRGFQNVLYRVVHTKLDKLVQKLHCWEFLQTLLILKKFFSKIWDQREGRSWKVLRGGGPHWKETLLGWRSLVPIPTVSFSFLHWNSALIAQALGVKGRSTFWGWSRSESLNKKEHDKMIWSSKSGKWWQGTTLFRWHHSRGNPETFSGEDTELEWWPFVF